jgi:hypothetical protein
VSDFKRLLEGTPVQEIDAQDALFLAVQTIKDACALSGHKGIFVPIWSRTAYPQEIFLGTTQVVWQGIASRISLDHDAVELWSDYADRLSLYAGYGFGPPAILAIRAKRLELRIMCTISGHNGVDIPFLAGGVPIPRFDGPPMWEAPPQIVPRSTTVPPSPLRKTRLDVFPKTAVLDPGTDLTFEADTSEYPRRQRLEVIFRGKQAGRSRFEFGRRRRSPQDSPLVRAAWNLKEYRSRVDPSAGPLTVTAEVSDVGSQQPLSNPIDLQIFQRGETTLDVWPRTADLNKNTDMRFVVISPDHIGRQTEMLFYGRQNGQTFEAGRYSTSDGKADRSWGIRQWTVNRGPVEFWVDVAGRTSRSISVTVINTGNPEPDWENAPSSPSVASGVTLKVLPPDAVLESGVPGKGTDLMFAVYVPTRLVGQKLEVILYFDQANNDAAKRKPEVARVRGIEVPGSSRFLLGSWNIRTWEINRGRVDFWVEVSGVGRSGRVTLPVK